MARVSHYSDSDFGSRRKSRCNSGHWRSVTTVTTRKLQTHFQYVPSAQPRVIGCVGRVIALRRSIVNGCAMLHSGAGSHNQSELVHGVRVPATVITSYVVGNS